MGRGLGGTCQSWKDGVAGSLSDFYWPCSPRWELERHSESSATHRRSEPTRTRSHRVSSGLSRSPDQRTKVGEQLLARDQYFMAERTAGTTPLDVVQAGVLRAKAAKDAKALGRKNSPSASTPTTFNSAWSTIGPEPIYQPTRDSGNLIAGQRPDRSGGDPPGRDAHPRRRTGRHLDLERNCVGEQDGQPALARDRLPGRRPVERQRRLRRYGRRRTVGRQLLRQRRPQVDQRRQHVEPRFGRLLLRRLDVADRRRPEQCEPPLCRSAARSWWLQANLADPALRATGSGSRPTAGLPGRC